MSVRTNAVIMNTCIKLSPNFNLNRTKCCIVVFLKRLLRYVNKYTEAGVMQQATNNYLPSSY